MIDAEQQASAIYELIRTSSVDRPMSGFDTVAQLTRVITAWKEQDEGLKALNRAVPAVHVSFLARSCEWLRKEHHDRNYRVLHTLLDAIAICLQSAPKPLPSALVEHLLSELRKDPSTRFFFPFDQFLFTLSPDQITDRSRAELRKLHFQLAPSPTGKIEKRQQETRDVIAALIYVEGDLKLSPGRGPWSQIVFDEIGAKDPIMRSGWRGLLEHCHSLEQAAPGQKWTHEAGELISALGEQEAFSTMLRWLALGPTPGQPPEARSPIEDSSYQKGVVLCVALAETTEAAAAIGDFAAACLRKIPLTGAVSQKVGFACIHALGTMQCKEAVSQLTRLRARVKYSTARRLIEKALHFAAARNGLTISELEDISVTRYPLDARGVAEARIGDAVATVRVCEDGRVVVTWHNASGKLVKSTPWHIHKAFPKKVRLVTSLAKEIQQAFTAQSFRLESSYLSPRDMPLAHWQRFFIDHPLLGFLGRKLIWVFSDMEGWERAGIWTDNEVRDSGGKLINLARAKRVRLWHPLSYSPAEVQRWRARVFSSGIRQPFRQAFREFYQPTDKERQTRLYSNRFAGILLRQHQFASLCRARGWRYQLMGSGFDGVNVPNKDLEQWNMHAEFYVDLPPDRAAALRRSSLAEQSGAGINVFVGSDQVRFYRDRCEVPLDEVPAIVFSEIMRDVDLFTSVCAVGDDETWSDQGERGIGVFTNRFDIHEFSVVSALRAEMLSRVLPHTTIADRCKLADASLEVRGQLGTYRIQLGWGGAMLVTDSVTRWLKIPQKVLDAVPLDLSAVPIDLDPRTELILRKAYVLADDWKIDSPELVRQLMPD
jgi:Domain of unknown function (DUF4132)